MDSNLTREEAEAQSATMREHYALAEWRDGQSYGDLMDALSTAVSAKFADKDDEGYGLIDEGCDMHLIADSIVPCTPYKDDLAWAPTWLLQAIRIYCPEGYNITTPVTDRVATRWRLTVEARESILCALESPSRQEALKYQYALNRLTRQQERLFLKNKWVLMDPFDFYASRRANGMPLNPLLDTKEALENLQRIYARSKLKPCLPAIPANEEAAPPSTTDTSTS